MRYSIINKQLFIKNRKKTLDLLPPETIAVVNAADEIPRNGDQTFKYRQNSDFFYFAEGDILTNLLRKCRQN